MVKSVKGKKHQRKNKSWSLSKPKTR